jgi:hypothetical protein
VGVQVFLVQFILLSFIRAGRASSAVAAGVLPELRASASPCNLVSTRRRNTLNCPGRSSCTSHFDQLPVHSESRPHSGRRYPPRNRFAPSGEAAPDRPCNRVYALFLQVDRHFGNFESHWQQRALASSRFRPGGTWHTRIRLCPSTSSGRERPANAMAHNNRFNTPRPYRHDIRLRR